MLQSQKKEKIEFPDFLTDPYHRHSIDINEILQDQDKIDRAILFKLKHQENTFVHFVEIDIKERWRMHQDNFPLLELRQKIWGYYA